MGGASRLARQPFESDEDYSARSKVYWGWRTERQRELYGSIGMRRTYKFIFVPEIGAVEIVTNALSVMLEVDGKHVGRRVFEVDQMRSDMAGNGEMYWLHEVDQNVFKLRERE